MSPQRQALRVLFGVMVAFFGCSDEGPRSLPEACDRIGHPDLTGPGYGVIGPEGGVVEQTDPVSPVFGVKVAIYYGAEGMLGLLDWYRSSEYIMCPPESAFEPLLMPPG